MDRCNSPSASRRSSRPWTRAAAWLLLVLLAAGLPAQDRKTLEQKRDALDKQIRTTSTLIEQAKKEQASAQEQVQLLARQIAAREELVRTFDSELRRLERRIEEDQDKVRRLEEDLARLKEEYGRMLRFAYRNRSSYDRLSYIFASESFTQAYRRSRYLDQIATHRRRQAELIEGTRDTLEATIAGLKEQQAEKVALREGQVAERSRLAGDRQGRQTALNALRKEEGRLKAQLKKQEKQRNELDAAIRRIIEEEVRRNKGSNKGTFTLTPEALELSADFEKNKGKLPWPVERGVITSNFGRQPHPVLPGITIENNGVDITTEKGAPVRAVFRGTVTSVIVIPGAGKAVVLDHGAYRSVYSNLRDARVAKGDKVETKQPIGTVMTEDNSSKAHVEIWKISGSGLEKVDPALWLFRQ